MEINISHAMLAMAPTPQQPGTPQNPGADTFRLLMPLVLMGVIFYFILIRPQQKKAKEHTRLLTSLKPGDKVVTTSGIVGLVLTVRERTITLKSADAKLEIAKSAVAEITERSGDTESGN